jgi:LPXTG-motif cell wall-anchored protein
VHRRRLSIRVSVVMLLSGILVNVPAPAHAAAPGVIASSGPLSAITVSADLNCSVRYATDTSPEFYGDTACGTLVAAGGVLYGPANIPAGSAAVPRTTFTPVSQTAATGAGTVADPLKVTTVVDLGTSGLRLTQTDQYVTGRQSYQTTVSLANTGGAAVDALVYRAGDCYVANSDYGKGVLTPDQVACVADSGRVAQWVPLTAGAHFYEANYSQVWARIGARQAFPDTCRCDEHIDNGAGLSWQVRVAAGSTGRVAHLTAFAAENRDTDADGDGLLDSWETEGLDVDGNGSIDVDLPGMGADPRHKDVFVEVDWMERQATCIWFVCWGAQSFAPDRDALADVRAAFAAAPVSNPDGSAGIRLHVDAGAGSVMNPVTGATWGSRSRANRVEHSGTLGSSSGGVYNWTAFNALQARHFEPARADVFHYAVYADRHDGGSSGIARVGPDSRFAGDAFIVSAGSWGGFSRRQEAGTFMHELGHTLGLHHGGSTDDNYKPNYVSLMSYSWQMVGPGLDYSRSALPALNEASLDEPSGVAGANGSTIAHWCGASEADRRDMRMPGAADFNCDGDRTDTGVSHDTNRDGRRTTLGGHDDWAHIIYDGGAVGAFGASDLDDQNPPLMSGPADDATVEELRAARAAAADGDGTVRWAGPTVAFPGVAGQKLFLDVANEGAAEAGFTVKVDGLPGAPATTDTRAGGYAVKRLELALDAGRLRPGTYTVNVVLTRPGDATPIARDTVQVRVPDLTEAATRRDANAATERLGNPHDGLDESIRTGVLDALRIALGGPGPVESSAPAPTAAVSSATAGPAPVGQAPGNLPVTGANLVAFSGAGVALVLAGLGLLLLIRRRRRIRFDA